MDNDNNLKEAAKIEDQDSTLESDSGSPGAAVAGKNTAPEQPVKGSGSRFKRRLIIFAVIGLVLCSFVLALVLGALLIVSRIAGVDGSGEIRLEERSIDGFTRIDVSTSANVYVKQGNTVSVEIETDDNLLQYIETNVRGDKLSVRNANDFPYIFGRRLDPSDDINIYITVKDIEKIEISGSSYLELSEISAQKLEVELSGSAKSNFKDITVEEFKYEASGSSESTLTGVINSQKVEISGSGSYDAEQLTSKEADIDISGSGRVRINVSDKLDIEISGSGEVYYKGAPDKLNQDISGSGKVRQLD